MHISKKSQAAMEFLMTYGWAIVIMLIALSALYYLGVFSGGCTPNFQITGNKFYFQDQKFIGSDSIIPEAADNFYMILRNNLPY